NRGPLHACPDRCSGRNGAYQPRPGAGRRRGSSATVPTNTTAPPGSSARAWTTIVSARRCETPTIVATASNTIAPTTTCTGTRPTRYTPASTTSTATEATGGAATPN